MNWNIFSLFSEVIDTILYVEEERAYLTSVYIIINKFNSQTNIKEYHDFHA